MGREDKIAKEFSEYLDRILAGEEIVVDAEASEELKTTLEFARRVKGLHVEPSPAFKDSLKQNLLRKLAERDALAARERPRSFWHFTWGRVMVAATAVVILILAITIWQYSGIFRAGTPSPTTTPTSAPKATPMPTTVPTTTAAPTARPTPTPPPVTPKPPGPEDRPLQVTTVPEAQYLPGQTVRITIDFTNIGPEAITLSQYPPEIQMLSRADKMVRLFMAGAEELQLEPGATATYNLTWDQRDENGTQVSPGWYLIDVKNVTYVRGSPPRTTRASFGETAKIYIQYPQGAMEKVIDLNQSKTVNGITITLERAELSAEGAMFYCFVVPPGYTPSQSVTMVMTPVHANYSFDGITRDAGLAGWGARGDGIKLVWGYPERLLDPVPSDARELTFTITRFGDVDGPWEFKIPLE
jgi:hypothetical protein